MTQTYHFPLLDREAAFQTPQQQAEAAYQRGLKEGRAAGFEAGKEQGLQLGLLQAGSEQQSRLEAAVAELQHKYQTEFAWLAQQRERHDAMLQQQLAHAVMKTFTRLAEVVLSAELRCDPQHLLNAIEQVLLHLQGLDEIESIQLATADLARLRELKIEEIGGMRLLGDDALPEGTAQFNGRTQLHVLDFDQRVKEALETLQQQLMDNHAG